MSSDVELLNRQGPRHRPTFRRGPAPRKELHQLERQYLEMCSGQDSDTDTVSKSAPAVLQHFGRVIEGRWPGTFDELFHSSFALETLPYHKALQICNGVGRCLRQQPGVSIARIIRVLQSEEVLKPDSDQENLSSDRRSQQLIFNAVGWCSMLYQPARSLLQNPGSNNFKIAVESSKSAIKSVVPSDKAARPMDELLRAMGHLFPTKVPDEHYERTAMQEQLEKKFQVSYLNVQAMKQLAHVEIVWVNTLSAHLEFDPSRPSISVFRCPSFCRLNQSDDALLEIIMTDLYQDEEKPTKDFNAQSLMTEIQLSYRLLFRDDRRARRLYVHAERLQASVGGGHKRSVDPLLDELCGKDLPTSWFSLATSVRDSYDADADFPILKQRLQRIQNYMHGIQPNRFTSLWRDRRDLRLWYTIWVVIILGVVGLITQIVGIGLAAAQVSIAQAAFELQVKQG